MVSDKEQLQKVKEFLDKPLFPQTKKTRKGKKLRLGVKADIRSFL